MNYERTLKERWTNDVRSMYDPCTNDVQSMNKRWTNKEKTSSEWGTNKERMNKSAKEWGRNGRMNEWHSNTDKHQMNKWQQKIGRTDKQVSKWGRYMLWPLISFVTRLCLIHIYIPVIFSISLVNLLCPYTYMTDNSSAKAMKVKPVAPKLSNKCHCW